MWIYNGNILSSLSLQTPATTIVPGLPLRLGNKDEGEFGHRVVTVQFDWDSSDQFVRVDKAETKLQITEQHSE